MSTARCATRARMAGGLAGRMRRAVRMTASTMARVELYQPAIAQLAEHLTVELCSYQMVPGSIPGGRISSPLTHPTHTHTMQGGLMPWRVSSCGSSSRIAAPEPADLGRRKPAFFCFFCERRPRGAKPATAVPATPVGGPLRVTRTACQGLCGGPALAVPGAPQGKRHPPIPSRRTRVTIGLQIRLSLSLCRSLCLCLCVCLCVREGGSGRATPRRKPPCDRRVCLCVSVLLCVS